MSITYVCCYWLSPDAGDSRETELRRYFDLQIYLKKRLGCQQLIVTNIDYPGAIAMKLPPKFTPKHALYTRYYGLKQLVESGLEFPICLHDHDFFNAQSLPHDSEAMLVGALIDGLFSEQVVVYPETSKQAVIDYADMLWDPDFEGHLQSGYGTESRHEGNYSTEQTIANLAIRPFESIPIRKAINVKDQVSFDIVDQHSLDIGEAACEASPPGTSGIHGHINKGQATEVMLDWLASKLSGQPEHPLHK